MRHFLILLILFTNAVHAANSSFCKTIRRDDAQLKQWLEDMRCKELNVGEKRLVDYPISSPTGISARYLISKIDKDKYQIDIPINLKGGPEKSKMEEWIKSCTKNLNQYLKGPNGEQLLLNPILKDNERTAWHFGYSTDIEIQPHDYRSNARNYRENIDCETIMHELLHLLGLVDEYEELLSESKLSTNGKLHNCRIFGPPNSIMNDQSFAFRSVIDKRHTYQHKISGTVCREPRDKSSPKTCRVESTTVFDERETMPLEAANNFKRLLIDPHSFGFGPMSAHGINPIKNENVELIDLKVERGVSKILKTSVLEPAHFRAIIYPGCKKRNATYYKCAELAYRTSIKERKLLGIKIKPQECNVPPECLTADWLK